MGAICPYTCSYYNYVNYAKLLPLGNFATVRHKVASIDCFWRFGYYVWPWSMATMAHPTHVTGITRSKEGRITLPAGVMSQCLDLRERWRAPHPVIRLQWQEFYGAVTKLFISEHTLLATCYICWQYTEEFVWLKDDQSTLLRRRPYCA